MKAALCGSFASLVMAILAPPTPVHSVRGYSDFFTSGFRAVTSRVSRPYSVSSFPRVSDATCATEDPPQSLHGRAQRRARPTSMIMSKSNQSCENSRGRRSSIIAFSSRLFDRMKHASADENANVSAGRRRSKRSSRPLEDSNSQVPQDWITTGGPFTPSSPNGRPDEYVPQNTDPYTSSPDSKSFFVDLSDSSSSKRESFLSLSGSSPDRSLLHVSRRERPASIQTMPVLSRSRRSSLQYRPISQDKPNFFWTLEEEHPILAAEPLVEDHEDRDDPARFDWRQFHVDLISDNF